MAILAAPNRGTIAGLPAAGAPYPRQRKTQRRPESPSACCHGSLTSHSHRTQPILAAHYTRREDDDSEKRSIHVLRCCSAPTRAVQTSEKKEKKQCRLGERVDLAPKRTGRRLVASPTHGLPGTTASSLGVLCCAGQAGSRWLARAQNLLGASLSASC